MTGDAIKKRIIEYIGKPNTNYAMMISGEWGTGKTYLLQNEIMPAISDVSLPNSDSKYRPVYVSLSGISTTERLTELMFASINLKPQKKETQLEFEIAQFDNQKSKNDYRSRSLIPENIVFCFDDLERGFPPFLEELLAYINTYIEHSGNKVLFVADERKIEEDFEKNEIRHIGRNFKKIKEKYIRRTFKLDSDIGIILKEIKLDEEIKALIKQTFWDGRCNNIRTLQFTIETLEEVLKEFNKLNIEEQYQSKLLELIVFYTVFVSIECKKGYDYSVIKDVNFPNTIPSDEWTIALDDTIFSGKEDVPKISDEEKEKIEKRKKEIEGIQNLYFPRKDEEQNFFDKYKYPERGHFNSIGKYIDSGELDSDNFEKERKKIIASLKRQEGTEDDKIRQKINSIYDIPDTDAKDIIAEVLELIRNNSYTKLSTYLSLFSDLLVLEYHEVHDFNVDKGIVKIFIESIEKSISGKILKIEPFLYEQTSGYWTDNDSLQSKKFHRFRECILKVNEELSSDTDTDSSVEAIIEAIGKTEGDLQKYVVESKDSYTLKDTDALPIFKKLEECTPRAIDLFIDALNRRYELRGGHTQASYERGFINKMLELVDNHFNSIQKNRPVSYIAFYNLKKKIEYWIKYYSLNRRLN